MCVALWLRPFFVPLRECSVCSLHEFFCCVRCYRFFAFFFFFFLHHLYTSDTRSFSIVSKKFRGPFLSNINTFFLSLFGKKKKSPMIFPPKPWVIFKIYIHTRIDPLTPRSHIDFFCVIKYVEMIFFFLSFAWWSAIERSHHIIDLNPGSSGSPHDVHWCPWVFCPPINRSYVTCSFLSVISLTDMPNLEVYLSLGPCGNLCFSRMSLKTKAAAFVRHELAGVCANIWVTSRERWVSYHGTFF